jgi:leader peptidase (prepilin peptidase) / N-methyltransferase
MSQAIPVQTLPATGPPSPTTEGPTDAQIRAAWQRPGVLLAAAVLAGCTLLQLGLSAHGIIGAGFAATLVVLAAIDIRHRRIPNRIVLPAAAAVLVLQVAFYPDQATEWIAASFGTALFLFLPLLVFPAGMGMGDVKLALLLGAMLGRDVIPALLFGFLSLWPVAIYLIATQGWSARKETVPFGPSLAFGAILVLLLSG